MTQSKLKKYLLPNIPYIMLFWFFSKVGEAYRITAETEPDALSALDSISYRLMGTFTNLNQTISNPIPSFNLFDIAVGLIGAAIIFLIVLSKKKNAKNWRKDIEYGSARWGTQKDIAPFVDPNPKNNIILTQTECLTLNSRPKLPKHARNKNVLIVGGSGSGKTRFFLKPNLMQLHSSYCITDPKGSILIECGHLLKKAGYEVKVLNTIDFSRSMSYNPFMYIRSEKDILKFVTALVENTRSGENKGGDPFWEKSEIMLYCALIGYIHYEAAEEERNMNSLVEMINSMEVRESDETFKNAVDYLFDELEKEDPQHFAVRQYRKYKLSAGKTAKSILVMCGARLAAFDIKEVRELMSRDDMELDTVGDRKTALFIIVSDTDDSFNFIAALMYSQLFNLLCDRADALYYEGGS